ncbi:MAG: hypothetical protein AAFR54_05265 [Planctomycetota bacterium]
MKFLDAALLALLAAAPVAGGCTSRPAPPVALSLVGAPLAAPVPGDLPGAWLQAEIDAAYAHWQLDPTEQTAIWVGRRLAYKGLFPDAVKWYAGALETYPESHRLRRHLGHRLLTLRQPAAAVEILTDAKGLAAARPNRLEPDGAPGPTGEPRSTTHGNIDYHLALAHYVLGEFDRAAELWKGCLETWSRNDDSRVAALHWLHTSLVRAGRTDEALRVLLTPIDPADVIENFAYHELVQLYRGERTAGEFLARDDRSAALEYGLARHLIANGDSAAGNGLLDALIERQGWTAFGVLAAEADVGRRDGTFVDPAPQAAEPTPR